VLLRKTVVLGVKDKETSKLHFKSCWFNGSWNNIFYIIIKTPCL
jgi:hypothetical protein